MKQILSTATVLVLALGSIDAAFAERSPNAQGLRVEVENLCGAATRPEILTIDVVSNGCTTPDDFIFVVKPESSSRDEGPSEYDIEVVRIVPDQCSMFSHVVPLTFDRRTLGLDKDDLVNIENPLRGDCPVREW